MSSAYRRVWSVIVCVLVGHASLWAADGTWTSSADGLWSETQNWQAGQVASGAGSVAYLSAVGVPVAIQNDMTGLALKGLVSRGGAYSLRGQPLTLQGAVSGDYGLVVEEGTLTVQSDVTLNTDMQFNVAGAGQLTTAGALAYSGNRTLVKRGDGEWVFAGTMGLTNASSYLDVRGGTLRLVSGAVLTKRGGDRQTFRVGSTTPGRVVVESGAALNVAAFMLGEGSSSATQGSGVLCVDGGVLTANSFADQGTLVGRYADSVFCVSNNAVAEFDRWLSLGAWARGELRIGSGGTVSAGQVSLGVILYEQADLNGGSYVHIGSGGTLAATDLFAWRSSGSGPRTNVVVVGDGNPGSGLLSVPATTRSANNVSFARLILDGGTLRTIGLRNSENNESLADYLYGLNQFLLGPGGGVIDTAGQDVTVVQQIARDPAQTKDGGLTKRGEGRLTLAGGCDYSGSTVVEQGMLRIQGGLPRAVVVCGGAALSLADGQAVAYTSDRLMAGMDGVATLELEVGDGANDYLVLPANTQIGELVISLVGLNAHSSYWLPGEYVVATYAGTAPDISSWSAATPLGVEATFEVQATQKRVVMRVTGSTAAPSVWLKPGDGAWGEAANWSTLPAQDPGASVWLGEAPGVATHITIGSGVTLGSLMFDADDPYTLSGAGMTFGAAGADGSLTVKRGRHTVASALSVPAGLAVTVHPGAEMLLSGGAAGGGQMSVAGGGTLSLADTTALNVPVVFDDVTLGAVSSAELSAAVTVNGGGLCLDPGTGTTLTLAGAVGGTGPVTKRGASVAVLSGGFGGTGPRVIQNGTLTLNSLTDGGEIILGEGRLKYVGAPVVAAKGLTIQTGDPQLGGTFECDTDVTLTGTVTAQNGVFIKTGTGTLTLAGEGENTLGVGEGSWDYLAPINLGAYGESPTQGLRTFNVLNGKVVLGAAGQTNWLPNTVVIGGQTTTLPGAETAGHLEIVGGYTRVGNILTVGRDNGSEVTAPGGLVSSVRIYDGRVELKGLWLASKLSSMATITARPLFEMNGGEFSTAILYGGSSGASRPRFVFNGGLATVTGWAADAFRLAYGAGVESELVVAGGTLRVPNTKIRLAENAATAKGRLRLSSGRLVTRGIESVGAGVGEVLFDGGVLEACQSMMLTNLSVAAVGAGGCVVEVPAGMTVTVTQPLTHDDGLGGTPDGGVAKLGGGELVLVGAQTYTGPTVVSDGTLRVAGTLAVADLTLMGGSTLSLVDGVGQTLTPSTFVADGARVVLEIGANGLTYDALALPAGFDGTLMLRLVKLGSTASFTEAGRYPLLTFAGSAPDMSGWTVEGLEQTSGFEIQGTTIFVRIGTSGSAVWSVWNQTGGGAWSDAANWTVAPANDETANVLFGDAIQAPATVTTGNGASFGYLAVDSGHAYTWRGGALTAGSPTNAGGMVVARGAHTVDADLTIPSAMQLTIDAGASLRFDRALSGAGSLTVAGGGTLSISNGPTAAVPLMLDGVTFTALASTTFNADLSLGERGAVVAPSAGTTLTVATPVAGPGGLTKTGSSVLTLAEGATFAGELLIRNGTVEMPDEPVGGLTIGEGTFKYTGENAVWPGGYTLRTTENWQAATLDTDADITFSGPIVAEQGAFIKWGSGTLTYSYAGENQLSAGDNLGTGRRVLNRGAVGDSPTQGYRSYNVFNGRVVLGVPGQTNYFAQAVIIGGQSTQEPGAETEGHMVVNGGTIICEDYITVGRGNGSLITAPSGCESSFTLNDGEVFIPESKGVWLASMMNDMDSLTAKPQFIVNGGRLVTGAFYCGELGGTARPRIEINGGMLVVGPRASMQLACCSGCETVLDINGGALIITNNSLCLALDYANAKGTLNLNDGMLSARSIFKNGTQSEGNVLFNGGVYQQTASAALQVSRLNVGGGGAIFDMLPHVSCRVATPLTPAPDLGGQPDGGLVKCGAGLLELDAVHTFSGATIVSNGVLRVSPAGELVDSPVTVAAGGVLSLQVAAGASKTLAGLVLEENAGLSITAPTWQALAAGVVSVTGDVVLAPVEVQLWGNGTITNGTYVLLTCQGTITGDPSAMRLLTGTFDKGYTFSVVGNELRLTVSTASAGAAVWISATGGAWADAANWAEAPGAGAVGLPVGFGDAIGAPASVTLNDAATVGELLFNSPHAYTLTGSGSLTLATSNEQSVVANVLRGTHVVDVPTVLQNDMLADTGGGELRLSGAVSGGGALTKTGGARLRLSGANSYAGGTVIESGAIDIAGDSPFGVGPVLLKPGSAIASKEQPARIANDVTMSGGVMWVGAYTPLTLDGDWTAAQGSSLLTKVATDELTFNGSLQPTAGGSVRLELRVGSVRFASGSNLKFDSGSIRDSIAFGPPDGVMAERALIVEPEARVDAGCLFVGDGATNRVSVLGGDIRLAGGGEHDDAMLLGNNNATESKLIVSGGSMMAADGTWSLLGITRGRSELAVGGGILSLAKVSCGIRDLVDTTSGSSALPLAVHVSGGVLEVRERFNWMADRNGARVNEVRLTGGTLRLPPTYATVGARLNQTRLILDGGVLESWGGDMSTGTPLEYLSGLKQAYVGAGGAWINTRGRTVNLSQRLTAWDGGDGGVVKCGPGTLALSSVPCVTGRVDVRSGTLRQQPDNGAVYPDDPLLLLTFEDGVLNDRSTYNHTLGVVGNVDNLVSVERPDGHTGVRFNGSTALYLNYRDDVQQADSFTVSAWVRLSAYGANNQRRTFFGTLDDYTEDAHDFLLRVVADGGGTFRWLGTGPDKLTYGHLLADVEGAVPLNTWTMLTFVVDGQNGFSMYVNGMRRTMKVKKGSVTTFTDSYGAGQSWLLVGKNDGKAFNIGAVANTDTDCFTGDMDDVAVYRRALSDAEIAMLYAAKMPYGRRVRVAAGAFYDLAGAEQEIDEVTGEGRIDNGTVAVTGLLDPGHDRTTPAGATLTVGGGLTLATNVTYICDWTPEANDCVDVWGTLTVEGAGCVDLGLSEPWQMPGAPRNKVIPIMYYSAIEGAANFEHWQVTGTGRSTRASIQAENGVVAILLEVPSGTLLRLR